MTILMKIRACVCGRSKAFNAHESSIKLLLGILLLAAPAGAQAQFSYTINPGGTTITITGGPGVAVTIPSSIGGRTVTSIANFAFEYSTFLTSVTIPGSVTNVGAFAFDSCPHLTNVTILNDSALYIQGYTFRGCPITSLVLPAGLVDLEGYAFEFCGSLTNVTFLGSAPIIGANNFLACPNLRSVYFYGNAPAVDASAFSLDTNAIVYYLPCATGWSSTFCGLPTVSWWQGEFRYTTNADAITITGSTGLCDPLDIPQTFNGLPVTSIGTNAFTNLANLVSITIPASVTNIGDNAFASCSNLTSVYFGGDAPAIGTNLFVGDSGVTVYYSPATTGWSSSFAGRPALPAAVLTQFDFTTNAGSIIITGYAGPGGAVNIPNSLNDFTVASIAYDAFNNSTKMVSVIIPASVTSIGEAAFAYCASLTNFTISQGVASIGQGAFYGCSSLTSISIPASVTNIGEYAFQACSLLTNATIAYGAPSIGEYAFYGSGGLTGVTIPSSVISIGVDAFAYCSSLMAVTIPDGVNTIGDYAYAWCASLTNVVIPGGVTNIGYAALSESSNLTSVYFLGNAPVVVGKTLDGPVFYGDISAKVYYLFGTTGWSSTFQGVPAVLWNPLIQIANRSFGVRSNQFGFNISGTANIPIVVEACTNLASPVWIPLTNVTLTNGPFIFSEPAQMNDSARFYRISSP